MEKNAREMEETDRRFKETDRLIKETGEQIKETGQQIKETGEQIKETDRIIKETGEQMKETDKKIGKLGNRFGEMVEYTVMPCLIEKFKELNFVFGKVYPHAVIKDVENNIITEVDITLENGDKVMIVEVKSKPSINDVKEHLKRMDKLRRFADLRNDSRKYLGAVAGMVINDNERRFVLKNGFYLIEPSGETFIVTAPEGQYAPREW
jgi:hypothetical protein